MQSLQNQNELREQAIRATAIPYDWLERLLPKLLLLPQGNESINSREREAVQKSVALCERLLAKRGEVSRLQKLIIDARQSESDSIQVSKLRNFFSKQTFVGDATSREGRLAFETRIALAEGHYQHIPKEVLKMLSDWENVIETRVGERRLEGIERLVRVVSELHSKWKQVANNRQKPFLGIRDRLKLLSVAARVSKLKRNLKRAEKYLSQRSVELEKLKSNIQRLVAQVALYHSIPTAECGPYSTRVQQLVMLVLEQEASSSFTNQCAELELRIRKTSQLIDEKNKLPKQARAYIDNAESSKNQRRIALMTRDGVETFDLLSKAAAFQIRSTFNDVEQEVAKKSQNIAELKTYNIQLQSEIKRLKNIFDDHKALLEQNGRQKHNEHSEYTSDISRFAANP